MLNIYKKAKFISYFTVHFCKDQPNKFVGYYAVRLFETVDGIGTDEQSMIRLVLLHSETDLKEIQDEFPKIYENRDLGAKLEVNTYSYLLFQSEISSISNGMNI